MTNAIRPLVLKAYSCSDYGDGPLFAVIDDAQALLEKVVSLQLVVAQNNLSEARIIESPSVWGPGEIEDDLRLQCGELVVCSTSAWFTDRPKHADYTIETTNFDCEQLAKLLAEGEGAIFFGDDPKELESLYLEALEEMAD